MRVIAKLRSSGNEYRAIVEGNEFWILWRHGSVSGPFQLTDERFEIHYPVGV